MEGGLFLDHLPAACKDQSLLSRRDAFLILDLSFDILNGVAGFNIQSDSLTRQGLQKDLHLDTVEGIFKSVRSRQ